MEVGDALGWGSGALMCPTLYIILNDKSIMVWNDIDINWKGLSIAKMKIDIFYPPFKDIECNQS